MIIAIDFDGTIVENKYPEIGNLKPNVQKIINRLVAEGHYIIIWTCRSDSSDLENLKKFLHDNNILYHAINENKSNLGFSPKPKIFANIYIDDRQLGGIPDDWNDIYNIIVNGN